MYANRSSSSALAVMGLLSSPGFAGAAERPSCVLDEECPHGRCIDLVCVDSASPSPPEATSAPPTHPSASLAPAAPSKPDATAVRSTAKTAETTWEAAPRARSDAEPSFESRAADEPPSDEGFGHVDQRRVWYGGPLIATYALTPLVVAASISSDSALPAVAAVFSSPVVHWVNGKGGKGTLSLFMQPVFAGVGALFGLMVCQSDSCDGGEVIAGAVVGYAGWAAIDIAAIAYKAPRAQKPVVVGISPFRTREATGVEVGGVW